MKRIGAVLLAFVCMAGTPASGWWGEGHGILTRAAVRALPDEMPAFFSQGEETIANVVFDADLFKNRATPHLSDAEHGEHYLDVELLEGRKLPETRYEFLSMCAEAGLDPARVGTLPYALAEWTERLAVALAEHRKWPENEPIQQKCLVYAGMLGHYAEDVCQPLHVTVDFDGRKLEDGKVVGKGIHEKVDALVEQIGFGPASLAAEQSVRAFPELMPAIMAEVEESQTFVDEVYAIEGQMGDVEQTAVRKFAEERARAAVQFTASLYLTAWKLSEEVPLPSWHRR